MTQEELSKRNRTLVGKLGLVVVAMFGFGFALVPLYDVFCDVTGLNGKTGRIGKEAALSGQVDHEREVTVEFVALINTARDDKETLPWEIRPLVRKIRVHPGEITEVKYAARNVSDAVVVGQAVPSMVPGLASKYFNKTECFCFTQQTLQAGEYKEMPLRFVVDPNLPEDVNDLVLSYTFYRQDEGAVEEAEGGLEKISMGSGGSVPVL